MVDYDERTALIVTDIQNDFADPKGNLYVHGGERAAEAANREIERARAAHATIVYTQDWHPEATPHFAKDGGRWPVHCVHDSWGASFHPDLLVAPDSEIVRKGTGGEDGYSGFTVRDPTSGAEEGTRLERLLRDHHVRRVVLLGLATDYCVKDTGLDALAKGFETVVVADAVRAVDLEPGDGERAIEELRRAGAEIA